MKNMTLRTKLVIEIVIVVVIAAITGAAAYVNDYYHSEGVESALETTKDVEVTQIPEGYFFDGSGTEDALIFYPGGKVEVTAYAPMMQQIAAEGVDCFLVKMPGNLAIFGKNKAQELMVAYDYDHWYLGGHSLGGAMAASYASSHTSELSGLLLLASYATEDLSDAGFPALVVVGTKDQVLNRDKYAQYESNLPEDTTVLEIVGGNHAYYGNYGEQDGDGEATITREEQQAEVVEALRQAFE